MGKLIKIGSYILKPFDGTYYWLERSDGEGTCIDKKYVSSIILAYFNGTLDKDFQQIM